MHAHKITCTRVSFIEHTYLYVDLLYITTRVEVAQDAEHHARLLQIIANQNQASTAAAIYYAQKHYNVQLNECTPDRIGIPLEVDRATISSNRESDVQSSVINQLKQLERKNRILSKNTNISYLSVPVLSTDLSMPIMQLPQTYAPHASLMHQQHNNVHKTTHPFSDVSCNLTVNDHFLPSYPVSKNHHQQTMFYNNVGLYMPHTQV